MVYSKKALFDQQIQEAAAIFKALSHPARLQIILFLAKSKSCFSGDFTEIIPLGRTTINQHLNELKRMGILQGQIQGAKTNYCLNPKRLKEIENILHTFISEMNHCKQFECK